MEMQEIPFNHLKRKIKKDCEGSQTLAQAAQRDCGVSILGDIWNVGGYSPGQVAAADLTLSRGLD